MEIGAVNKNGYGWFLSCVFCRKFWHNCQCEHAFLDLVYRLAQYY